MVSSFFCGFCTFSITSFNAESKTPTALAMCEGARQEYLRVIVRLLCPKSLDTNNAQIWNY